MREGWDDLVTHWIRYTVIAFVFALSVNQIIRAIF